MASPTSASVPCRACGAAVRPDAPWCTQCYAPAGAATTPAEAAGAAVAAAGRDDVAAAGALRAPAVGVPAGAVWPCGACGQQNDLADERCASCGEAFLGALRQAEALLVLPVVGDLTALPPARRVGVAVAAVAAFLVLAALLGLLLA